MIAGDELVQSHRIPISILNFHSNPQTSPTDFEIFLEDPPNLGVREDHLDQTHNPIQFPVWLIRFFKILNLKHSRIVSLFLSLSRADHRSILSLKTAVSNRFLIMQLSFGSNQNILTSRIKSDSLEREVTL